MSLFAYTTVITSLFRGIGFLWDAYWSLPWWVSLLWVVPWVVRTPNELWKSYVWLRTEHGTFAAFFTEVRRRQDER